MNNKILVSVSVKEYKADTIRYAAYAASGVAYVLLKPGKKGQIEVSLEPKPGAPKSIDLKKRFLSELEDEQLRSSIEAANRELKQFVILKALSGAVAAPAAEDSGLSTEQEKELDTLIAEVEREIKAETAGKKSGDPLGISRTWEEKYDAKRVKNKNKK